MVLPPGSFPDRVPFRRSLADGDKCAAPPALCIWQPPGLSSQYAKLPCLNMSCWPLQLARLPAS